MSDSMHSKIFVAAFVVGACDVRRNPEACFVDKPCPQGMICNFETNRCEAAPETDAATDADTRSAMFDVIYGDDWRISTDGTNDGWFLLVSNGAVDPDLSTIKVLSVNDSHPLAIVRVVAPPASGVMVHGRAAGKIFIDNQALYAASVPEPRSHIDVPLMNLELLDAPAGDYLLDVHVEVSVDEINIPMDFKIRHVDSQTTYFAPEAVKRTTVLR